MAGQRKKQTEFRDFDGPRPEFNNPPVNEVVLSLQFEPIVGFDTAHIGLLWQKYRRAYPKTTTKGQINPVIEGFEKPRQQTLSFKVVPDVPRCWFENKAGTELIQVQQDRFLFNWKQTAAREQYVRYEIVRRKFLRHLNTFESFLREHNLGKIVPNQCEVTYVNQLAMEEGWNRYGQLGKVFSVWSGRHSDAFLGEPEDVIFRARYRMMSKDGKPLGRLHVVCEPRIRGDDGSLILRLELTARGTPLKKTKKAVFEFFDFAREYIVRGFASITSKGMHGVWERTDA